MPVLYDGFVVRPAFVSLISCAAYLFTSRLRTVFSFVRFVCPFQYSRLLCSARFSLSSAAPAFSSIPAYSRADTGSANMSASLREALPFWVLFFRVDCGTLSLKNGGSFNSEDTVLSELLCEPPFFFSIDRGA